MVTYFSLSFGSAVITTWYVYTRHFFSFLLPTRIKWHWKRTRPPFSHCLWTHRDGRPLSMSLARHRRGVYLSSEARPSRLSDGRGPETRRQQPRRHPPPPPIVDVLRKLRDDHVDGEVGLGQMREGDAERGPRGKSGAVSAGPFSLSQRRRGRTPLLCIKPYVVFIAAGPSNTICDLHPRGGTLRV